MTPPEALSEFILPYLAEVEELLASARACLLGSEAAARKGSSNPRGVRELFRAVHTIKGLSAMVEVEPVVGLAHWMEASLRRADQAGGALPLEAVDRLFQGLHAIEQRVHALGAGKPVDAAPRPLLEALEQLATEAPARPAEAASPLLTLEPALRAKLSASELQQLSQGIEEGRRAVLAQFSPSPEKSGKGLTISSMRERLSRCAELVKILPISVPVSVAHPGGLYFAMLLLTQGTDEALLSATGLEPRDLHPLENTAEPAPALAPESSVDVPEPEEHGGRQGVVRVDSLRLDDAMEHVAGLVVSRSRLERAVARLAQQGVDTREVSQVLAENSRLLRDMRASVLRLRMVPVREMLERLPLMVRGLRRTTGKQVRLELELGNAELDKAVGDRLFPAIVHLVRNAVDHAIEGPAERERLGKPPEGLLRISCHERSNSRLELSIQDDGRGVDAEAVARRAGVATPSTLPDLLELLCRPGLSTKQEVTTTSGRGMGMDIVKRIAVQQLGGDFSLVTASGVGTTFTLRVPLTISIVEAFIFESGTQRYATAVSGVEELMDVDPARVVQSASPDHAGGEGMRLLNRRGEAVPLLGLAGLLQGQRSGQERKAIVIQNRGGTFAFGVDRLLNQQEIVIRPLEDPLVHVRGVSGATDLGDGLPTLVLDLAAFSASLPGSVS